MDQHCEKCEHKNSCEAVYERLCNSEGPSVFGPVLAVFVMPVFLFVCGIVLVDVFFAEKLGSEGLGIAVMVLAGVLLAGLYVLILRRYKYKNKFKESPGQGRGLSEKTALNQDEDRQ